MNQLEPCPACHRHVMVNETTCPFCQGSLADAFASVLPRVPPRTRLHRAAILAFGALAVTGCTERGRSPPPDAAMTDADAPMDAGTPFDADEFDGGTPIYAAAPTVPKDAGTTTSRG